MTTLTRTALTAGQTYTLRCRDTSGNLVTPTATPTATMYTDTARTAGAVVLSVAAGATAQSFTVTLPSTAAGTRYLKHLITTAGGTATDADDEIAFVSVVGGVDELPVTRAEIRARLNTSLTVDDTEIAQMLDAALAEYAEWVGPLPGTVIEKHDGGNARIVLRSADASTITAAAYSDGTAITLADLDLDTATGIVHWAYGTVGYFTAGTRNVTITYTVGSLPDHHKEAIRADVAGYFEHGQRGAASSVVDDNPYGQAITTAPLTLFPRIRALGHGGFA